MPSNRWADADWASIRVCICSGLSIAEVSRKFGVPYETVKKRVDNGKWLEPRRRLAKERAEMAEQVSDALLESWAEKGEKHRAVVFDMATKALKKSKLTAPKTWRDAEIVDGMARRAAGLDKMDDKQPLVNIGLLGTENAKVFVEEA